jgi:hypothetical protein
LLQGANPSGHYVTVGATQKKRTVEVRVVLKHRYDIDKAGEDDRRAAAMFGDMFQEVLCPDASEPENASPQQMSLPF